MTKFIIYFFEAICIFFLFLVVIGIAYGISAAMYEAILMVVKR
jgi:hypothetical protein